MLNCCSYNNPNPAPKRKGKMFRNPGCSNASYIVEEPTPIGRCCSEICQYPEKYNMIACSYHGSKSRVEVEYLYKVKMLAKIILKHAFDKL